MSFLFFQNKNIFNEQPFFRSLVVLSVNYECEQLIKAHEHYKKIFGPIINLKPNDKLGISEYIGEKISLKYFNSDIINFNLYLDKYKIYQSMSRWYWNQKRNLIFPKLTVLFEQYTIYLNKLIKFNTSSLLNDIINDIKKMNKQIIEQLKLLKNTYNDPEISMIIDTYCNQITSSCSSF
jgi:hypothetical protein